MVFSPLIELKHLRQDTDAMLFPERAETLSPGTDVLLCVERPTKLEAGLSC